MKEQPERKVNTDLTEPEKISIRKWCIEQTLKYSDYSAKFDYIFFADDLYNYIVNGNEQKL